MEPTLKYAVVERERRYLVRHMPQGVVASRRIADFYIEGSRLRLRETTDDDGAVTRKLGHKVRLSDGPREIACTSMYLDDTEWALLRALPARELRKTRHFVEREGVRVAIDEFADGTLLAEINDEDLRCEFVPAWLDVISDVTSDEAWTGVSLAR